MSDTTQRLEQLKAKYQSLLKVTDQQQIQLQNLHVQDNKLFIRGVAPSDDAKNRFWDELKRVNPQTDDITADITVDHSRAAAAGRTYTVKAGDTLSKISKQFYGDANEYMRIFNANKNILNDPDKIQPGQVLTIPESDRVQSH
jgi:nucleoid-associated protein YgaU